MPASARPPRPRESIRLRPIGQRIRIVYRSQISLLPLLGLLPAFLLATYSLTQPWAVGRALVVWKISRSPGAALLLAISLAGMVAASVAVAARNGRREVAGLVHVLTAFGMGAVALAAYAMIRDAGVRLLGLIPLASIRPGPGLRLFLVATLLVLALGLVEILLGRLAADLEPTSPGQDNRGRAQAGVGKGETR